AAFAVVFGATDAAVDANGARPGEDGCAGIALPLRHIPIGSVSRWPELLEIIRAGPGFLKTENIRLFLVEVIEEVFPQRGAQAVHIPRNQLHGSHPMMMRHLVNDDSAVDQSQREEADAGEVLHAEEGFLAEFAMAP